MVGRPHDCIHLVPVAAKRAKTGFVLFFIQGPELDSPVPGTGQHEVSAAFLGESSASSPTVP